MWEGSNTILNDTCNLLTRARTRWTWPKNWAASSSVCRFFIRTTQVGVPFRFEMIPSRSCFALSKTMKSPSIPRAHSRSTFEVNWREGLPLSVHYSQWWKRRHQRDQFVCHIDLGCGCAREFKLAWTSVVNATCCSTHTYGQNQRRSARYWHTSLIGEKAILGFRLCLQHPEIFIFIATK